jgi:hypothetical protein
MAEGDSDVVGAPIRVGWASPLRVATGGNANDGSGDRRRRSPAHANIRRDSFILLVKKGYRARKARLDQ